MAIFKEIFNRTPEEQRQARAAARETRLPNSYDGGGPARVRASERRIATRNMDELIGMCRMVLADGAVDEAEARTLLQWIESHLNAANEWPGNVIYERVSAAMADGHLDEAEEKELLEVLGKVIGGSPTGDGANVSGAIPFDEPPPPIAFAGQTFVVTGQFAFGSRAVVSAAIEERGGHLASSCTGRTDYLIVGTFGSEEWLHSTHGTKILKAIELKQSGKALAIVSEKHWTEHLTTD